MRVKLYSLFIFTCLVFGCSATADKHAAGNTGLSQAQRDIVAFKNEIKKQSPDELVEQFIPAEASHNYGGYEYYFNYMVNIAIQSELESRGAAAFPALSKHTDDNTTLWEAVNGQGMTIGDVCSKLLDVNTN